MAGPSKTVRAQTKILQNSSEALLCVALWARWCLNRSNFSTSKSPERLVHLLAVVAVRCVDPDSPAGMTSKFFTHGFLLKLSSSGEEDIGPYRNSTCRYKGDVPLPTKDSRPSFQFRMPPEGLQRFHSRPNIRHREPMPSLCLGTE